MSHRIGAGGGVKGKESLQLAAEREVKEETGLTVKVGKLAYIEEFWQPTQRSCKFWFHAEYLEGEIDATAEEAVGEHIVDARFVPRDEIEGLLVFPPVVQDRLWQDLDEGFPRPVHLCLREIDFLLKFSMQNQSEFRG